MPVAASSAVVAEKSGAEAPLDVVSVADPQRADAQLEAARFCRLRLHARCIAKRQQSDRARDDRDPGHFGVTAMTIAPLSPPRGTTTSVP